MSRGLPLGRLDLLKDRLGGPLPGPRGVQPRPEGLRGGVIGTNVHKRLVVQTLQCRDIFHVSVRRRVVIAIVFNHFLFCVAVAVFRGGLLEVLDLLLQLLDLGLGL